MQCRSKSCAMVRRRAQALPPTQRTAAKPHQKKNLHHAQPKTKRRQHTCSAAPPTCMSASTACHVKEHLDCATDWWQHTCRAAPSAGASASTGNSSGFWKTSAAMRRQSALCEPPPTRRTLSHCTPYCAILQSAPGLYSWPGLCEQHVVAALKTVAECLGILVLNAWEEHLCYECGSKCYSVCTRACTGTLRGDAVWQTLQPNMPLWHWGDKRMRVGPGHSTHRFMPCCSANVLPSIAAR